MLIYVAKTRWRPERGSSHNSGKTTVGNFSISLIIVYSPLLKSKLSLLVHKKLSENFYSTWYVNCLPLAVIIAKDAQLAHEWLITM